MKPSLLGRALFPLLFLTSCQVVKPYAPAPQLAVVEELEVITEYFEGRADHYAIVRGHLSSNVAVLIDALQSRQGSTLFIEVREQTPRGAVSPPDMLGPPPFESKIPIESLGLIPGEYVVNANGVLATLEISDNLLEEPIPAPTGELTQI